MAGWKPIKRREFISAPPGTGIHRPFRGTRHEFLVFGQHRQTIPGNAEYSVPQVKMLLRQVGEILGRSVTTNEWEGL